MAADDDIDDAGDGVAARELIADVLLGTRRRDDPEVHEACTKPGVARLLDELIALQTQLELAAALTPGLPAAGDPLHAWLRDALPRKLRQERRPRRTWGILLAAALLLGGVLALVIWLPSKPADIMLTQDLKVTVQPGYTRVAWSSDPGQLWFQVRVNSLAGEELDRSDLLRGNEWRPERNDLPDEVRIEIWIVDSTEQGRPVDSQVFGRDGRTR